MENVIRKVTIGVCILLQIIITALYVFGNNSMEGYIAFILWIFCLLISLVLKSDNETLQTRKENIRKQSLKRKPYML
ncbi:MAG: hypothetical protein ACK5LL_00660 [Suipraeoptans sp.]